MHVSDKRKARYGATLFYLERNKKLQLLYLRVQSKNSVGEKRSENRVPVVSLVDISSTMKTLKQALSGFRLCSLRHKKLEDKRQAA